LAQLARQDTKPQRIVVCPAGPDDYDPAAAPPVGCPIDVLPGPRGLTLQRNRILESCTDIDVLVFLDDDFYPALDYVHQVNALFSTRPEIVVATNHPVCDGATGPGISHERAIQILKRSQRSQQPWSLKSTYGGYGCNMALRVAPALAHDVRFDVNLPLYGWLEDIDFSRRMAAHGRIVNCSSLLGVHLAIKHGRTSGLRVGYSQVANPLYLLRKGSLSPTYSLRHLSRNVAKNLLRVAHPEPWVDRRGRLRGNFIAFGDLLLGRLDPRRIHHLR
ncbi:MAG TPA: glycosyltransferase, partial [Burkholderiaceae bacterium]|nr:glycosyltransferase [Burkholderiaceae bacterium]